MIGKWPGGRGRIWGGPYTVAQVVVLAVSLAGLVLTRGVWARFGLLNFVIALGLPYGLSLLVRHVQVDGRSPLSAAASGIGLLTRPAAGRLGGRPLRALRGRHQLIGVCSLSWAPGSSRPGAPRRAEGPARVAKPSRPVGSAGFRQPSSGPVAGAGRRPVSVAAALVAARRSDSQPGMSEAQQAQRGV
ncbi:hypothetical protein OG912_37940 (plasmid) [Streptomyces sp. NBC_00464]|uniref:hypothetical protein n=1 Tax=Streptomyces sp. NBC_00464 TaxID=2975751 RepID=UPI002E1946B2